MPASPDFRLYHGNALDVLAELLARELRHVPPGTGLLEPDTILIPQPSMRRWLQATLAERHGIAANLRFLTPGEFVGEVLAANVPGQDDARSIEPSRLVWRLYKVLNDPASLRSTAIAAALDRYLEGPDRALRAWSLAHALADVFTKYQAWRRDWLLAWDRGADRDDWQAELWRRATRGLTHRAQSIDRFLRAFDGADAPVPRGLPARVFAFACLNVSPDVLRIMTAAARGATVHFYLPTPSRKYWGDLVTLRERLAAGDGADDLLDDGENPLLAAWGRAGRDFIATLFSHEIVAPREIEAYAEPKPEGLLQRLQLDLLERRAPQGDALEIASIEHDRTLQIHACHTRAREVEVLHDQLRALFEDDPALEARDVAVMTPDINLYAPYIAAIFGGAQGTPRFIPYTVADESSLAASPVADLALRILGLERARLTSNEVLDLIALPPLMRRFDLDAESIDRLRDWVLKAGARWGLDAAHRARLGAPPEEGFTWRFALDRLLLGHAAGDDADIAGVAPWPDLEGHALDALDALIHLLAIVERASLDVARAHTAADWQALLTTTLEALLPLNPGDAADARARDRVFGEIDAFGRAAAEAGLDDTLPADVVRAHFAARFADADARQPFLAGGVTFCRMVPMRLIPFRVICLLGLNDRDYPRQEPSPVLNRLAAALDKPGQRRRGDRSVRDDDRFLFLQLLTAAERVLYLSYIGRDAIDGSAREPSIVVSELLDVAASYFDDAGRSARASRRRARVAAVRPRRRTPTRAACVSIRHGQRRLARRRPRIRCPRSQPRRCRRSRRRAVRGDRLRDVAPLLRRCAAPLPARASGDTARRGRGAPARSRAVRPGRCARAVQCAAARVRRAARRRDDRRGGAVPPPASRGVASARRGRRGAPSPDRASGAADRIGRARGAARRRGHAADRADARRRATRRRAARRRRRACAAHQDRRAERARHHPLASRCARARGARRFAQRARRSPRSARATSARIPSRSRRRRPRAARCAG